GSYVPWLHSLLHRLVGAGVEQHGGFAVGRIERDDSGFAVHGAHGESVRAGQVVATMAPGLVANAAPQLSDGEKQRLAAIPYQGVVCAALLSRKPLSEY